MILAKQNISELKTTAYNEEKTTAVKSMAKILSMMRKTSNNKAINKDKKDFFNCANYKQINAGSTFNKS